MLLLFPKEAKGKKVQGKASFALVQGQKKKKSVWTQN